MYKKLLPISFIVLLACQSEANTESTDNNGSEESNSDTVQVVEEKTVSEFEAVIDQEAMEQIGQYDETEYDNAIELYHSGQEIESTWSDKLWGRCCTEVDLSLCEVMSLNVTTSAEGSKYPFKNALESMDGYNTAYVFDESDNIEITISLDLDEDQWLGPWEDYGPLSEIIGDDVIMSKFQFSLINGYTKSKKTFEENARIEWVQLWHNGEHKCNVKLLDVPDVQMIEGNFSFKKDDIVKLVPISYYKGSKYDDVCITTVQHALGYSCDLELLKKGDKIAGIDWRGYE